MPGSISRSEVSKTADSATGTRHASLLDSNISGLIAVVGKREPRKESSC